MFPPTPAIFGLHTYIKKSVIPCSCQERKRGRGGFTYLSMVCCDPGPGPGPGPGGPGRRSRLGIGRLGSAASGLTPLTHDPVSWKQPADPRPQTSRPSTLQDLVNPKIPLGPTDHLRCHGNEVEQLTRRLWTPALLFQWWSPGLDPSIALT